MATSEAAQAITTAPQQPTAPTSNMTTVVLQPNQAAAPAAVSTVPSAGTQPKPQGDDEEADSTTVNLHPAPASAQRGRPPQRSQSSPSVAGMASATHTRGGGGLRGLLAGLRGVFGHHDSTPGPSPAEPADLERNAADRASAELQEPRSNLGQDPPRPIAVEVTEAGPVATEHKQATVPNEEPADPDSGWFAWCSVM